MLAEDELKIEKNPEAGTEKDKEEESEQIPKYMSQLDLDQKQKERITKEFWEEFEAIKRERADEKLESKWDMLDAQYEGVLEEDEHQQFNIHVGLTKSEVDRVVNRIMQAYMESDPMFAITPRRDFNSKEKDAREIAEKQQDYLDYTLDEIIPYREPSEMTIRSAVKLGNGIKKWEHKVERENRKREEIFKGSPRPVFGVDPQTGQPVQTGIKNKGLEDFIKAFPQVIDKEKGLPKPQFNQYIKALAEGKEINILAEYPETLYNDAFPKNVELRNFYVRTSTEGNLGLAITRLVVERINYNWWELQKLADKPEYFEEEINKLSFKNERDERDNKQMKGFQNEKYDILEATFMVKIEEDDEEETKCIFWFSEDRRNMIGAVLYQYYAIPSRYVESHICKQKPGFYQPGIAEILTDDNITIDALINSMLEGVYTANLITPIVKKGSSTELQFLNRRAGHGVPIVTTDGKPLQFFNQFMKPVDVNAFIGMMEYISRSAQDKTGGNDAFGGNLDPIDPTEPGNKFIARLSESNINIRPYILAMLPSFNLDAYIILAISYQIDKEGRKYRKPSEKVVGDKPGVFDTITRQELIARTNIQSRAYQFAVDKINEKRENLMLTQLLRNEIWVAQDPEAVFNLWRSVIKNWSPYWKNNVDRILPKPDEIKRKMVQVASLGAKSFVQASIQQSKLTGMPPEYDPKQFLELVAKLEKEIATPPSKEEIKERRKSA